MTGAIRVKVASDRWQIVAPQAPSGGLDTVRLCLEFPGFLAAAYRDTGTCRIVIPAPGSTTQCVLVSVDAHGGIVLVACPEALASADMSALVADVLATAGRFWHQSFETFVGVLEAVLEASVADRVGKDAGSDWDAEEFKAGIERSLNQGKFPIVVVARQRNQPVEDMLQYLAGMNFPTILLGYRHSVSSSVEFVVPVPAGPVADEPVRSPQAAEPAVQKPRETESKRATVQSKNEPQAAQSSASSAPVRPEKLTDKQREIVGILSGLEDLKLDRHQFEFFLPGAGAKETSEGAIVIAADPERWPFPKPDEVIVVVNIAQEHLAGYLKVSPEEIRDFLSSLPREERREHKGCVLLRASNVSEAFQLVNELKALKEVSVGGVG